VPGTTKKVTAKPKILALEIHGALSNDTPKQGICPALICLETISFTNN
jgi:hypothetical protein